MAGLVDLLWGTVYNPRNGNSFMKRLLLALVPWMAITSAARAQAPADVVFTHHGIVNGHCVRVDEECYAPFTFLDSVGWTYSQKGDSLEIRADDQKIKVGVRDIGGNPMIPLRYTLNKLGGDTSWDGNNLIALARLTEVQIKKGHFIIQSTIPVEAKVSLMDDPNRVVVDILGAKLDRRTNVDLDGSSRIGQWKPDTVRVVLETEANPRLSQKKFAVGTTFEFDVTGATTDPVQDKPVKQDNPPPAQSELERPVQTGPKVPLTQAQKIQYDPASDPDMAPPTLVSNTAPPVVGPLTVESEGPKITALTLQIVGGLSKMPNFRRPDANVIEIVLPGAKQADGADFQMAKGPTIRNVDVHDDNGSLVIALTLARPMGIEFSMSAAGLQIQLLKPDVGNGHLAGKVVVVDAGHGGHDEGTQSAGVNEKDLTLSIAKRLSSKLASEGATVIMTRKTDVFISLGERPEIANRNGADFFVSVHINSNELDNTASGSITFFHAHDPICQLMADCIQREIVKTNGIGGMGVWSDQKIYRSGFAVLRGAKMPAVLVECGFLNTKKDRARMVTDDFQDGIASAIVKGLKAYLGDEGKKK